MSVIDSISPAFISPIATGALTITGSGFTGLTGGTLDGRALTDFVVVSDTEIAARWPLRVTNGRYNFQQGSVDLVLDDDGTKSVAYVSPVNLRCAQHLEETLAAATTANEYFFNWSQAQVIRGKFDISTRAANGRWPIGVLWLDDEKYNEEASTANLRAFDLPFGMGALMPLADGMDPTAQATLMVADLVRAAFLDISQGGNALSTDVTAKCYGIFPDGGGGLIGAHIEGTLQYQHVAQDSTQEIFWKNTQF